MDEASQLKDWSCCLRLDRRDVCVAGPVRQRVGSLQILVSLLIGTRSTISLELGVVSYGSLIKDLSKVQNQIKIYNSSVPSYFRVEVVQAERMEQPELIQLIYDFSISNRGGARHERNKARKIKI